MKTKKTINAQRKILSDNIKRLLKSKGKSQTDMARELGIAETTVSSWVNCERYPRIDKIQQMADYFGVYRSEITDDKSDKVISITSSQYPVHPAISAGLPIEIDGVTEDDVETISIPDYLMGKWAGNKDIFITRTNGDSMNRIIPHDSLIAVKPVEVSELKDNDIVVYRNGTEYAVKRFIKTDKELIFRPDSTDRSFRDDVINIDSADDLYIKGKVVMWLVTTD